MMANDWSLFIRTGEANGLLPADSDAPLTSATFFPMAYARMLVPEHRNNSNHAIGTGGNAVSAGDAPLADDANAGFSMAAYNLSHGVLSIIATHREPLAQ